MATTKKGDTAKATKAPAATTKVSTRKGTIKNTTTAKVEGTAKTSPTKPDVKKPAAVKLTDNQVKFLQTIQASGETGYEPKNKNEQRSIDAMVTRKLLKKGEEQGDGQLPIPRHQGRHLIFADGLNLSR